MPGSIVDFDDSVAEAKRAHLRQVAAEHGLFTFVETGTSEGQTVAAMIGAVSKIISIEFGKAKYLQSSMQFLGEPSVKLIFGDSAEVLERVVQNMGAERALFWLDAHSTAADGGADSTPVDAELRHVLHHRAGNDVILIDDAHLFGTDPAYPTLDDVEALITGWHESPRYEVFVEHNIIHALPVGVRAR